MANPMDTALMNHLILDNLLSKLALSNLKSCRLVSSKWNELTKKHVIKLSRCRIASWSGGNLEAFNRDFSPPSHMPFKNFHLQTDNFWLRDLETFFHDRTFIQELTLLWISIKDDSGSTLTQYNISPLLSALGYLSVLKVVATLSPTIVIPFSCIPSIKCLSLQYCGIEFDGRIAPTQFVALQCRELLRNGEPFENSNLILNWNEFVDVTYLKEFFFSSEDGTGSRFDLTNCLGLEYFAVRNTEVSGWHNSNLSSLNTVYICDVQLDLSDLPPSSLVDLDISDVTDLKNSANIQLTNLKQLTFREQQQFSLFSHCPNLQQLKIRNDNFDLDNLPTSVRSLTIRGACEFVGGRDVQLDKLVFMDIVCTDNTWERVRTAIERLKPATVVLCLVCSKRVFCRPCADDLSNLTDIVQKQITRGGKFIINLFGCKSKRLVGIPFKGCPVCFITSMHSHPVSKAGIILESEYHLYEKGFGRIITRTEYDQYWRGLPTEPSLKDWHWFDRETFYY